MPRDNDRPWDRDDDDRPRRRRDEDDDSDDRPRRRRRDEDDYDDDRPRRRREYDDRPPERAGNGLAVAALVLGLLAFCAGPLTGVPAVICGLIALGKPTGRGLAITGLLLGILGSIVAIGGGYLLYTRVETARMRMIDSSNLKQIGVGMHNQNDSKGEMAAPYALDRQGKVNTGLSWRVGILPYIEQDSLYRQFNLTQPWDGGPNRSASNTPIATFTSPFENERASVNTPYRVFYGGGALFDEDGEPVGLGVIPDGTSNTIMVVHAAEQVPWAQPKEFKYSPTGPLPKLGHPNQPGGFQALMADGSVRFISEKVSERTLRGAITRAGDERLGPDW